MKSVPVLVFFLCLAVAALLGWTVWTMEPVTPAPRTAQWEPTSTPDNRIETVQAMLEPTPTWTPRPTLEPRPTHTPLPYCFGEPEPVVGTSCNPKPPTPITAPTQVVTVQPLTCATVVNDMRTGKRSDWPYSCKWDGPTPTATAIPTKAVME